MSYCLLRTRSSELTSSSERRCATPEDAERALLLCEVHHLVGKSDDDVFFSTSREIVQLSDHLLQDIKTDMRDHRMKFFKLRALART
jgi:hypothetical protein